MCMYVFSVHVCTHRFGGCVDDGLRKLEMCKNSRELCERGKSWKSEACIRKLV